MNLPRFLAKTQYKEPMDAQDTNFMDANPDHLGLFPFLQSDRDSQAHFMGAMRGLSQRKRPWTDYFDTSALVDGHDAEKPLLVDVGGGHSLDVLRMLKKHGGVNADAAPLGELVLQDLPEVVALTKEKLKAEGNLSKVKVMAHNFFEPQPLTGTYRQTHPHPRSDGKRPREGEAEHKQ